LTHPGAIPAALIAVAAGGMLAYALLTGAMPTQGLGRIVRSEKPIWYWLSVAGMIVLVILLALNAWRMSQ
jgi:uncharacterized membrane protein